MDPLNIELPNAFDKLQFNLAMATGLGSAAGAVGPSDLSESDSDMHSPGNNHSDSEGEDEEDMFELLEQARARERQKEQLALELEMQRTAREVAVEAQLGPFTTLELYKAIYRTPLINLLHNLNAETISDVGHFILAALNNMAMPMEDAQGCVPGFTAEMVDFARKHSRIGTLEQLSEVTPRGLSAVTYLKSLVREDLGPAYPAWSASPINYLCPNSASHAMLVDGNSGLARLFCERYKDEIKITASNGAYAAWNSTKRLWEELPSRSWSAMFVARCAPLIETELALVQRAYNRTVVEALDSTESSERDSDNDGRQTKRAKKDHNACKGDAMLEAMVGGLGRMLAELKSGRSSQVFQVLCHGLLHDEKFLTLLDASAPDHFPLANGMLIDLKLLSETNDVQQSVRPRVPTDLFSWASPVNFVPGLNRYENIKRFIWPICGGAVDRMPGDQTPEGTEAGADSESEEQYANAMDMFRSLHIHLGAALTAHNTEKKLWQHLGPSNHGKSTLWNNVMKPILGPFLVECNADMLVQMTHVRDAHSHTAAFMPLIKARIAWFEEGRKDVLVDEAMIKRFVTGGAFTLPVRAPCGHQLQALMRFKLVVLSNFAMKMSGTDAAALNRMFTLLYQTKFSDRPDDPLNVAMRQLLAAPTFLDEAFSWLVEGAVAWYQNNGTTPLNKYSAEKGVEIRDQQAPVEGFLNAMCEPRRSASTAPQAARCKTDGYFEVNETLFEAYRLWLQGQIDEGVREAPPAAAGRGGQGGNHQKAQFYRDLESRGFACCQYLHAFVAGEPPKRRRVFLGIKLKPALPTDA